MLTCCVVGCENRYFPSSRIKFYRIPAGRRPFHVNRRRLWVEAIQKANGSTDELSENARVCGDHFVSGELSLDTDNKDFVPSVFTSTKQSQVNNTKRNGCRRRGRSGDQIGNAEKEERPSFLESPEKKSPASVMMETENEAPGAPLSPSSEPKEKEDALTNDDMPETKTESTEFQETSSSSIILPKQPEVLQPNKRHPIVVLKRLIVPDGDYRCDRCNQTFISVCQLVKHTQLHEEQKSSDSNQADMTDQGDKNDQADANDKTDVTDQADTTDQADLTKTQHVPRDELSFMCNMCDQAFTTSRNLKRHKLLHVKDCRKCLRCGTLFCRRHNHFTFWPRPGLKIQHESESFSAEMQDLDGSLSPEKMGPSLMTETAKTTPPTPVTVEPSVSVSELVPKTSCQSLDVSKPVQVSVKPNLVSVKPALVSVKPALVSVKPALVSVRPPRFPSPPSPIFAFMKNTSAFFKPTKQMPSYPSDFVQPHLPQHPELPPSLKVFSPQFLTSALLDVERNYEYLLSKAKTNQEHEKKIENTVKEEPMLICPVEQPVQPAKDERIAYDLEIIL